MESDEQGIMAFGYEPRLDNFAIVLFDLDNRPLVCMTISRTAIETALAIRATAESNLVPHAPAVFHMHTLKGLISDGQARADPS